MKIRLLNTTWAQRRSATRLPFRYGSACLTWCPQVTVTVQVEVVHDGQQSVHTGHSGDCLPPLWFDKRPGRDYQQQLADMRAAYDNASYHFCDRFRQPETFFDGWLEAQAAAQLRSREQGWPDLLGCFGVSFIERAMIDAVRQSQRCSFHSLLRSDLLALEPGRVDDGLGSPTDRPRPSEFLPPEPTDTIFVRHTVGLGDPLTAADLRPEDRVDDGEPQTLEEYIRETGICYFKIKVANRTDEDIQRLTQFATLVERYLGTAYQVTLDGNEQYRAAAEFDQLVEMIRSKPALKHLWHNCLVIEQPLARDIALEPEHTEGVRRLSREKPVIIDESDQSLACYPLALKLGYRGVSSKNCKGPVRSLLHAATNAYHNRTSDSPPLVMTAEDLCCVGRLPVESDLRLVASLGLTHGERNGHHYHNGLSYLPEAEQQMALDAHPDLYTRRNGAVRLRVQNGQLSIGSLVNE